MIGGNCRCFKFSFPTSISIFKGGDAKVLFLVFFCFFSFLKGKLQFFFGAKKPVD